MSEYESKDNVVTVIEKNGVLFIPYSSYEYKLTPEGRWFRMNCVGEWERVLSECVPNSCIKAYAKHILRLH